jgi:hypothetical protein
MDHHYVQSTLDTLVTFLMANLMAVSDSQNCCYCSVLNGVIIQTGGIQHVTHVGDKMYQNRGNVPFLRYLGGVKGSTYGLIPTN